MPDPTKLSFAIPAFNAIKNYDRGTLTVSISGTIASGAMGTYAASTTLRRDNSTISAGFTTSVTSNSHTASRQYYFVPDTRIDHGDGSTPTFPGTAVYSIVFETSFSGDNLTIRATIGNETAETLTVVSETLEFEFYSYIAPFA